MARVLSDEELAYIRTEIGDSTPPDDTDLQDIFDRLELMSGTAYVNAVILDVIRKRIGTLAGGGALSFSVPGEYSEDRGANLTALERQLERVQDALVAEIGSGDVTGGSGPVVKVLRTQRKAPIR